MSLLAPSSHGPSWTPQDSEKSGPKPQNKAALSNLSSREIPGPQGNPSGIDSHKIEDSLRTERRPLFPIPL